jgi:hypothetical protein
VAEDDPKDTPPQDTPPADDPPANDPPADDPAAPQRPDFLPEAFWDADAGQPKLEDLAAAAKRYDDHFANRPESYKVDGVNDKLPENIRVDAEAFAKLPVMGKLGEVLHKLGGTQEDHDEVTGALLETMGALTKWDPTAEVEALGERGADRMKEARSFASTLGSHVEDENAKAALLALSDSSGGVQALEAIHQALKGTSLIEPKLEGVAAARAEYDKVRAEWLRTSDWSQPQKKAELGQRMHELRRQIEQAA